MATTFEKTWAFDLNRAYAPASAVDLTRYTMWLLAAQLTGNIGGLTLGLWTLYASSDSVTAGTDSTDRWILAGPYNGTKIVRGASSAIHSWIVLRSPSMNGNVWYMILSYNTATDATIQISFTKTAPTGGGITVTPTATDQWWSAASSLSAVSQTINAGVGDNSRFNMGLTSEGGFYFLGCKQGTALPNLVIIFAPISNKKLNDLYPVWAAVEYRTTGVCRNTTVTGEIFHRGHSTGVAGHSSKHPVLGTHCTNPLFVWYEGGGSPFAPAIPDVIDGTYPDIPLWIGTGSGTGTSPTSIRGRLADFAGSPNTTITLPEASVSPTIGSVDSCRVGNVWFPANAVFNFG